MLPELRFSLLYFLLASLWILLSDRLLSGWVGSEAGYANMLQSLKGILFVVVTSAGFYSLLRWEFNRRRQSEQFLREKENHFRYLFMNNPLPMWVYDQETLRFLDVNEAAMTQYGYTHDEFLAMRITNIRPDEDVPRLLEAIKQQRPTLQFSGYWRHRFKNGQVIDVEITSHTLDFAQRPAVLVVAKNVTEMLKTQNELHKINQTLRALIDASPLAILVLDRDGYVKLWSPAAERIFGWSTAEVMGQLIPTIPPDKRDEHRMIREQALAGQTFMNYETQHRRKDGKRIDVSLSTSLVDNPDNDRNEIMAVMADITERKRLEADLLEKERLRLALNKEIDLRNLRERFISTVSHEFRNPLSVIATSNSMLEHYFDRMSPETRQEHFQRIQTEIQHLTEMLNDLLTLLRSESIGAEFSPLSLDLVDLSEKLVEEAQFNAQSPQRIAFTSPMPEIRIQGDAKLLRHAIRNLLANAIKYSSPERKVDLTLQREDDRVRIQVRDQGIGIPPDNLQRIFEPFYRADNVHDLPGTGLGLAITKQAVELHGGTIQVESVLGAGTTFIISLPILTVPEQKSENGH